MLWFMKYDFFFEILNSIFELRLYSTCTHGTRRLFSEGSICHKGRVVSWIEFFALTLNFVISTNFASTCIAGKIMKFLLEFELSWLLE